MMAPDIPTTEFHSFGDPADIAVAELSSPLNCYSPIDGKLVRHLRRESTRGILVATGFPSSKVKVSATKTDAKLYSFLTFEEDKSSYLQYGMNSTDYLVLNYDKENMMGEDLRRTTTPDPVGMSGGGLFLVPEAGRFGPVTPLLVGIMTGWDKKNDRFLATQMSVVGKLILDLLRN